MIKINNEFKNEVMKGLAVLEKMDIPMEVRMIKTIEGTRSGYYQDKEKLINDIQRYDGIDNIFFTLNDFSDDLLARGKDKLLKYAKNTTTDQEIETRRLLLIDVDPERPAGISSTNEELQSAYEVLKQVVGYLSNIGFSAPVVACSGNGYHALYKIDLPNTKEVTELIKRFLVTLDKKFSNEKAKIDKTTYNASRITKLYGTIACKGDNMENRPHRRSKIIDIPDVFEVVEEAVISKVILIEKENEPIKENVITIKSSTKENAAHSGINVEEWLERYNIPVSHKKEYDDRTCYVLEKCPWNENHTDRGASITQFHDGGISAKCHHDSCSENNWESLREMYEPKASRKNTEYSDKTQADDDSKRSQADVLIDFALENNDVFFITH